MTPTMTTREPAAQALNELSNLLAITLARSEALLADGAGANLETRTDALKSIRRSVLRARDTLGRLQRMVASGAMPGGAPAPTASRPRVLVIDDDPLML